MADRVSRKMAAILAADVAGFSRLIGEDEEATLERLAAYREIIDQLVARHSGRVFGSAGDSVVAEFASAVEAVRCATEIQIALGCRNDELPEPRRLRFRIGINLGDVVVEGDNLMGDGVNVAARLESMSQPGGLCVSETIYAQARDRLSLDFVDLGEHRLKNIARPVRAYRVPLSSEAQVSSPYRGLDVFEYENADLFFGRARAIAACMERLQQLAAVGKAFLLVYGMTGSGKSSLLRAGLLPAVTRPYAVPGIAVWRRCLFRPSEGPDAIAALTTALYREDALPELALDADVVAFTQLARSAPDRALALTRQALAKVAEAAGSTRSQARLVVAVDQLEELFTTEKQESTREALVRLMETLASSGLVWLMATIRSDFFHRCGEVPGFSALKDGLASYELLPPTGPEVAQIIREPARVAGLTFEESADQGRLDDVLQEAAAADPGSLPLLEFVLDALYETGRERRVLTFAQYRALGGLEGAIARRADEVVESLAPAIGEALPAVLRALTTVRPGDEKVTARPAPLTEVASSPARLALVDALVRARLLVTDEDVAGHVFVRVAHEALLSRWPRASAIVDANRSFLETRARVAADAHRWHADNPEPGTSVAIRQASRRGRGPSVEVGRSRRSGSRIHRGVCSRSGRKRGKGKAGRTRVDRGFRSGKTRAPAARNRSACRRSRASRHRRGRCDQASAAHTLRSLRRNSPGVGSRRRCVLGLPRTAGSKPASRARANQRGQGKVGREGCEVGREGGCRGARSGAP